MFTHTWGHITLNAAREYLIGVARRRLSTTTAACVVLLLTEHHQQKRLGGAVRRGTWPRWCCDLDCAAEPASTLWVCSLLLRSQHLRCCWSRRRSALLLCCRREPSRKCRFHPLQSERVRSRRTALHPLPPRRTPPSLFFLIWTPEEIYIYKSVAAAATSSSSATASRTFRRRLGASLSLCPGFLQRHAARGIIVVIAEPSFTHTHTHLTASAPPPSRAHTAPIFLHF